MRKRLWKAAGEEEGAKIQIKTKHTTLQEAIFITYVCGVVVTFLCKSSIESNFISNLRESAQISVDGMRNGITFLQNINVMDV